MLWFVLALVVSVCAQAPDIKHEQITGPVTHGEGPHWSDDDQALYWVDIPQGDVWRYHPESGNITRCNLGGNVTMVIPVKGEENMFVVGLADGLQQLTWDGHNDSTTALRPLGSVGPLEGNGRMNDGKVDANGRLWIGTIGNEVNETTTENEADLYRVECVEGHDSLQITKVLENVTVSNGIAWSADGTIMYYIDSPTRKIDAFDFEAESGNITNRRTIFDLAIHNISGVPDGMTIDADDNLWIALFAGGSVIQVNPHLSRLLQTIPMDGISRVTSVAWGSKELDELYVTTSGRGGTGGGQLFKLVGTKVHGKPANEFDLGHCKKE